MTSMPSYPAMSPESETGFETEGEGARGAHADGNHSVQPNGSVSVVRSNRNRPGAPSIPADSVTPWPTSSYSFVVVSNRLPIDHVVDDDRAIRMEGLPGRPRHGARAGHAIHRRRLGRLGRPARSRARPLRQRRHPHRAGAAQPGRPRDVLRGLQQRHPLAAVPRRHRAARLSPGLVGQLSTRSTSDSRTPWSRIAARGATVWVQDYQLQLVPRMLRLARPDLTIGFFNHIPFPAYGIYSQLPWRTQIIEGLLGADVVGFQRVADAGNFSRAVRRLLGYSTKSPFIEVPATETTPARRVMARPFPISIDVASFEELARQPDVQARAAQIRVGPRQPADDHARRRPARLHEGHRPPAEGVRRAARGGAARGRGHHARAGREPEPRACRGVPAAARRDRADRRSHQRRLRHDQPPGGELPAPRLPARGDGGALPGGRRHARHRAPRRDEPGREGVRRGPLRRGRRARAERVHRRVRRVEGRAADQPARHRRRQGRRSCVRSRCRDQERRKRMRSLRRRVRENDVQHWSETFLASLRAASSGASEENPLGDLEWTVDRPMRRRRGRRR